MTSWTNPGESLSTVTSAQSGTAVDFMGENTGADGTAAPGCPSTISMVVTIASWVSTYNLQTEAAYPYANVGLEVSMDDTNWVRIANCTVTGDGQFKASAVFPARYARATLDALDSRITGISVTAYVAGGS